IFTLINNCPYTIWPGTLASSGTPQLPATGFQLDSGQGIAIPSVPGWSGRIWARTGCIFDETGTGSCETGDCGGRLECDGLGATPPASLFEITLGVGEDKDFYDVSIVDGYNLPLVAAPRGVQLGCNATGCVADINMGCPKELQVIGSDEDGGVVACRSACDAFRLDEYCCSGEYANPSTCRPSFYSGIFKRACPRAYSYAFDDGTSTFTCKALEYAIIFCPNSGFDDVSHSRISDIMTSPSYLATMFPTDMMTSAVLKFANGRYDDVSSTEICKWSNLVYRDRYLNISHTVEAVVPLWSLGVLTAAGCGIGSVHAVVRSNLLVEPSEVEEGEM
ncbi:thaumatin-like protein 1, partial [Dorcoceras hygrometricum]